MNIILKKVLKRVTNFENHKSQARQQASFMTKLFIASFVNTALITLLINMNLDIFETNDTSSFFHYFSYFHLTFFDGKFSDFSSDWYFKVGSGVCLTMIFSSLSVNVGPILLYYSRKRKIDADRSYCKTGDDREYGVTASYIKPSGVPHALSSDIEYREGDQIEARYMGKSLWLKGKISKVHLDGDDNEQIRFYDIVYEKRGRFDKDIYTTKKQNQNEVSNLLFSDICPLFTCFIYLIGCIL